MRGCYKEHYRHFMPGDAGGLEMNSIGYTAHCKIVFSWIPKSTVVGML